jgi:thiol:disulfide interchange protein DsbD
MRSTGRFLCLVLLGCFLPHAALLASTGNGVRASLVTDAPVPIVPGKSFYATVVLDLQAGWHTYWEYPGDSGLPPKVEWHLPEGWAAGPIEFSVPHEFSEPGDMVIYGYETRQLLRATITPPKDLAENQVYDLKASLTWLACKELCVPGSAEVSLKVPGPTDGPVSWMTASVPKGIWPLSGMPPFPVSVSGKNGTKLVSFIGENGIGYEFYPDPAEGTTAGRVTQISSGNAIVFSVPCDVSAPFKGLLVEKVSRKAWWIGEDSGSAANSASPNSGIATGVLIAALFSGFLGGLILNLMPCVLPVISLKIFSFISQSGESPSRMFRHGLAFSAGIFAWFLGLALLVIVLKSNGTQVTWGAFQFQNPYFVIGLSLLVFLLALNLFGIFEITLPGHAATTLDQASSHGGYTGSFFQGLFATLLATPCTAPFLGSALGFAFSQSGAVILVMFASVAFGMSLPYLLLSARPGWRQWIPKPGIWMEKLKQFMGFPLLATNLWLLWVLQNQRGSDAALALLALFLLVGFCAWGYGSLGLERSNPARWVLGILLLLLLLIGSTLLVRRIRDAIPAAERPESGEGIAWRSYSPEALDSLRKQGKPVFLVFTASWCLTCQFNERTAINVPSVRNFIKERGITAMKGDWTNADPAITSALKSFGRVGVPLAVFYPSGKGSEARILPELLTEGVVLESLGK